LLAQAEATLAARIVSATGVAGKPSHIAVGSTAASDTERARTLIATFEAELAKQPFPERAGRLHYECARLWEYPLGNRSRALEHYRAALEHLQSHGGSLRGARRLLVSAGDVDQALPLFDREASGAADASYRALVLEQKGRFLEKIPGKQSEALAALEVATHAEGRRGGALDAYMRALRVAERWEDLEPLLEQKAASVPADPQHRAALTAQRAALVEVRRADAARSTELYQAAIELDPHAPGAVPALKALDPREQRFRHWVTVLEHEVSNTTDPVQRARALEQIARVSLHRLGDLERAQGALERATRELPQNTALLDELTRLYELGKNSEGLVGVLTRRAELVETPAERVVLFHRLGELHERELHALDAAVHWYSRALAAAPAYAPSATALTQIFAEQKNWEGTIQVWLNEAEAVRQPQRRAALYARIAELYERELGNPEAAIEHHARALGLVRGYAASFKALVRLYNLRGRHSELIELLERAVEETRDVDIKLAHLFEIGLLHEDALKQPAHAVTAYERILELAPEHRGAILALERAAERARDYPRLVRALELEARTVRDTARAAELLHRAAEVTEQLLTDTDRALSLYRRVLEIDAANAPTIASLCRVYRKLGKWEDLLAMHRRELGTLEAGEAAALLCQMAELAKTELGRPSEAVALYREALRAEPAHELARRALERALFDAGDFEAMASLLEEEVKLRKTPFERARLTERLGSLLEHRLSRPKDALAAYERALAELPEHPAAIEGRIRLLAGSDEHARVAEELERLAQASAEPQAAVSMLFRAALLRRDRLNDPASALRCLEAALSLEPRHLGSLLALESLLERSCQFAQMADVLRVQVGVLTDPTAKRGALHRLARILDEELESDPKELEAVLLAALELDANDLEALLGLEKLALKTSNRHLLAQVDSRLSRLLTEPSLRAAHFTRLAEHLESLVDARSLDAYRAALEADPNDLAAAHGVTRAAQRSQDPELLEEAAELERRVLGNAEAGATALVRAARLHVERHRPERAEAALTRALELDPDHVSAADEIETLLRLRAELDTLIQQLSHAAQRARTPERRAALWRSVAAIYANLKHDLPAGLVALERVTKEQPEHAPAFVDRAALHVQLNDYEAATRDLEAALRGTPDPELAREVRLQLAAILDEHLEQGARALEFVEQVLEADPKHAAALARVLDIHRRAGRLEQAIAVAEKVVDQATTSAARGQALVTQARLERERGELAAAARIYERAVELVGLEGQAASELRDLHQQQKHQGQPPALRGYVAALERFATREASPRATPVVLEAARVLAVDLHQNAEALALVDRGLAWSPDSADLHAERGQRLVLAGELTAAADSLRRVLELDVTRASAFRALSAVLRQMNRQADAIVALAPVAALGEATDLERSELLALPIRAALAPAGALTPEEQSTFDGLDLHDPTRLVLGTVQEVLPKLLPPDLSRFGLAARDRLASRSGHPLRALSDRVAGIFGVSEHQLFLHERPTGAIELELTDPVSLVIPAYVQGLPEPQQVFLLARAFANLARRLVAVDRLPAAEVELLVVSALRSVVNGVPSRLDEAATQEPSRRIGRQLSRRARRTLEELAQSYPANVDFAAFVQRAKCGAARAAVLVADDLVGSVTLHRRLEGDLSGLSPELARSGMLVAEDLLRFWVSEPAFRMRRRLGLI
jgi:tetratricopeptide (TPR) repeat protein